jgi:spore germination protein KC
MIKKTRCFLIVSACLVLTTGCWDRLEVNDAAIVVGSGVDLAKDNEISVTAQFKQPVRSTQGEIGQNYFSAHANGKNVTDAMKNMQAEISRRIIRGQRQIIFVGEDLARKGIFDLLDSTTRNPESKMRIDVMVVQGGTAEQVLKRKYPLEPVSAIAALKEKMAFGMEGNTSLRNFLVSASTVGSSPTLEALQIISSDAQSQYVELKEEKVGFRLTGSAIFNKELKLVGFLNLEESKILNWIKQELKSQTITITKPNMGRFSFVSSHLQSKIRPDINGGRIKFHLTLEGSGAILENSIPIDLNQTKNLSEFEDTLNQETQKNVIKMVKKVQNVYGTDIFGFGESIHKKYPQTWKSLKNDWDLTFADTEVDVKVNLVVKRIGTTGPSLHLKKGEFIK